MFCLYNIKGPLSYYDSDEYLDGKIVTFNDCKDVDLFILSAKQRGVNPAFFEDALVVGIKQVQSDELIYWRDIPAEKLYTPAQEQSQ